MSTGEMAKTTGYASAEDEDWLYGDNHDDDDAPGDDDDDDDKKTETEIFSALVGDAEGANGVNDKDRNADSDSDSDDNLRVTISNIKAGCVQSTTPPVSLKTSGTSSVSGTKVRGRSGALVVVDRVVSNSALQVEDEVDEKPWRKPGADLSDYFNYGFNEDSWKVYCDKQRRLRMSLEFMNLGSSDQSTGSHDESASKPDCSSGKKSSIDVIGGQTETIVRVEGRRHHSTDGSNTQVQPSPETPINAQPPSSKLPPFFPHNIPPPPFPLLSISSTPPFIQRPPRLSMSAPPPGFPFPPEVPSPFTSGRAHSGGSYDGVFAPLFPFPAGVYPHAVGHMPPWPDSGDRAKLWKYSTCQDKERERGKDRERTRERERDKEPKKEQERERDQENTPSFPSRSSDKEHTSRHRDHSDRGRERYREHDREGREREDRHRNRRHRDRNERHKSSRSSRKRYSSDDAESHSRHGYKRTKRNKDSTDTESTD